MRQSRMTMQVLDATRVIKIFGVIIGEDGCIGFVSTLHQPKPAILLLQRNNWYES